MNEKKQDTKINLDTADLGFAEEIALEPGGQGIRNCYSCGKCTVGCPVKRVTGEYDPRRIIRLVLLGQKDLVLRSKFIWYCADCCTCQERCPQDVHIPSIMTALRNIAARNGIVPAGFEKQYQLIENQGRLYEIDEFDNKKRTKSGLPPVITDNSLVKILMDSLKQERRSQQ